MNEEMAKPGRSRIIKNLTPSLTERGKIKIGEKGKMITSQGGSKFQLPKKLEYFRVVSLHRGDDGNYIGDEAVHERYGEKPTELPVRLLFDDIELNFQCRYSCFKGKQQWCSGDGEYGWRIENGERKAFKCPCHRQDPAYEGKDKCKINSCLSVLIDGVETIGGVWKFRTTSYNSTVGLLSSLTLIKSVTGGPLAGIPLALYISPKTVVSPTDGNVQTIYIVGLEYKGSFNQLQKLGYTHALDRQKHMIRMEDIEDNARKLLQAGDSIVDEDVVDEFYPEQAVEDSKQKAADLTNKIKEKPDYTATELKDKLDAGDKQVEGYQGMKPTVNATTGEVLDTEPETKSPPLLPAGVDPTAWLTTCKPRSSVSNAELIIAVYDANEKTILNEIDAQLRLKIQGKKVSAETYLGEVKGRKQEIAEEEPPMPEEAPFEPDPEPDEVNGKLKFLAAMKEYKIKNPTQYGKVLDTLGFASMNDVKNSEKDHEVVLGFLREEFGE